MIPLGERLIPGNDRLEEPREIAGGALLCAAVALIVALEGCGLFSTRTRVANVSVERKENGYLVELPGSERHPQTDVLVTRQRWVILTIVDPLYDLAPLDRFTSPDVDSLEYTRFTSAVQIALRFRRAIEGAHIVSRSEDPSIVLSVFYR